MLAERNVEVAVTLPSETEIRFTRFFPHPGRFYLRRGPSQNTFAIGGAAKAQVFLSARSISESRVRGRSLCGWQTEAITHSMAYIARLQLENGSSIASAMTNRELVAPSGSPL